MEVDRENTPVFDHANQLIDWRLKKVEESCATSAADIRTLTERNDRRFDSVDSDIKELIGTSSATAASVAEIAKTLDSQVRLASAEGEAQIKLRAAQQERAIQIETIEQVTTLEVTSLRAKTELEDAADRKKQRRALYVKLVAALGAVWATISTLILARC
jgi:conjugal transfer/entry exclusion protein